MLNLLQGHSFAASRQHLRDSQVPVGNRSEVVAALASHNMLPRVGKHVSQGFGKDQFFRYS